MSIEIDTTLTGTSPEIIVQPVSASVGGISFSTLPPVRIAVLATSMFVMGTIPVQADPLSLAAFQDAGIQLVIPTASDCAENDEYATLREAIEASGIPMLSDEEVRREIRERKGGDSES
jgi:hypothetical protein